MSKQDFCCYVNQVKTSILFIRKNSNEMNSLNRQLLPTEVPYQGDSSLAKMLYPEFSEWFDIWDRWDGELAGDRYAIDKELKLKIWHWGWHDAV